MKRIFKWLLVALLLNTVLTAIGVGAFFWKFQAKIPALDYSKPADLIEARLQDLDYLKHLTTSDHSFSEEEKVEFFQFLRTIETNVATLSNAEFAMEIARAAAITDNGHTNISLYGLTDQLNSLPLRFSWFEDGLYIVRARDPYRELLGARVARYDGNSPESLLLELNKYYGGNSHYVRFQSPLLFSAAAGMDAIGLATRPDRVTLQLVLDDGSSKTVDVPVEETATEAMSPTRHLLPVEAEEERESGHEWHYFSAERLSSVHFAQKPDSELWHDELPGNGVYVRLRITMTRNGNNFSGYLKDLKDELESSPADYLVLDLRSNPGGDYMQSRGFAKAIANYVKSGGHVYLLSDGGTFSAAIVTLAFALEGAGKNAIVVGSHVGDDEQFWAESGGRLKLPNSGLSISVATGYHDWENGCKDFSKCYWPNVVLGVAAGPLDPDIVAPLTFSDYRSGVDTTMKAVFEAEGVE